MTNFAPGIDGNYKGEIDNINSFIGDIDPKNVFLRDYEALINLDLSDFDFTGISIDDVLSFLPPELRTGHVVSILQQILDGDLSLVIQGQSLIRDLFNKYGPNTSLFDAMEMEGYFGEESGGGASLPDYLFNLPDDFGYSTLQDIAGAIVSPLYDLHADGSWNVENLSLPDSAEGVLGDVRDDLFDQIGATAIDQLVDVAADKLGRYGELFKDAVGLVKDSLDVKKSSEISSATC